jgi:BirA family biotin operon repressor/biotin-[acetyl-CoA-carboxylase] ligase
MEYRPAYAQLQQACQRVGPRANLFEELPSTQDEALRLARTQAPSRSVVLAVRQSAGRGRSERSWDSPCGGVWGSWIFRDVSPIGLTLLGALAVARVVEGYGQQVMIRWPNDVLVHGRKIAGVLADVRSQGSRIEAAVLGVGVNVNLQGLDFSVETRSLATSLQLLSGQELDLGRVFEQLDSALARAFEAGWVASLTEVRSRMMMTGTTVEITVDGKTRRGEVESLLQDGGLSLRDGTKLYRVDRLTLV